MCIVPAPDDVVNARRLIALVAGMPHPEIPRRATCGMGQLHQHRRSRRDHRVLYALCKTWNCSKCRLWLQHRWTDHLTALFPHAGQLHVLVCTQHEWDSKYARQVNRTRGAGGGYVRLSLRETGLVGTPQIVISTAPVGSAVSADDAAALVADALSGSPATKRPVYTSRSWNLPTVEKTGEWERIDFVDNGAAKVREVLASYGIVAGSERELRAGAGGGGGSGVGVVDFTLPAGISSWRRQALLIQIAVRDDKNATSGAKDRAA